MAGHGNIQSVYIFLFTAIFILLIACINFMNLSTARSARRAREVGFRKVAGALRSQIAGQFLTESCLIACISLLIATGIIFMTLPSFNAVSGQELSLKMFDIKTILTIVGLTIVIGLIAGSYPALYLSGFQPVKVLSMQRSPAGSHQLFRNALVVTQFVFSIILLIGTVTIHQQQKFIREQNLGFDKENLLYVALRGKLRSNQEAFRAALERNSLTEKASFIDELPTNLMGATVGISWEGKNPEEQVLFAQMDADEHFIDIFKMQMRSGRSFSKEFSTEDKRYIVNEKALQMMGFGEEEAVGKSFTLWDSPGTIVGVVKDFHFKPIQQPIDPMVIRYNDRGAFIVVRTQAGKTDATIEALQHLHQEFNPDYPLEYGFLNQDLNNLYQSEKRLGKLVNIFALLAIFISCLGLYGLSAFLAERRKKEISIRKVIGASVGQVVYLLVRDFTRPIWIAMIIALPLAFSIVNKWLENFAYHVEIKWWVLTLSCLSAWLIAMFTVSFETVRAAIAHPSKALQSE
jgi:predicted lysophospholipase L1 biosynthesis ABC-type transport system permease subunit